MTMINLPYGIDDFRKVRESNCYYVDKTPFVAELLSETFSVNLITRPRRFGKTLAMSMLAEFFDIRFDSTELFKGLAVSEMEELCGKWLNKWPVLYLTLKDIDGETFEDAYNMICFTIASLCEEHRYPLNSRNVSDTDKKRFLRLLEQTGEKTDIRTSLFVLTRMMKAHYGQDVILLIDEYNVPLAKASDHGYYKEMLDIVKTFLGMAWKSNPALKFAVVTGCLRIAKESIFTGANNFISNSISDDHYSSCFGFTEPEVCRMLADAGFSDRLSEMKRWYDGYFFGNTEVYCPWDVINHLRALGRKPDAQPGNYWRDTNHNNIIRRFIDVKSNAVNGKFETLLAGGIIREPIIEDLNYDNANSSEDYLWSILYLTGYLTKAPDSGSAGESVSDGMMNLRIPNEEVKTIFADTVKQWFTDTVESRDRQEFFEKWWNGNDIDLTKDVTDILFDTISYFDYKEDYYHAFLTGLFSGAGYEVKSNSEQGTGRADIVVTDRQNRRVIIIEAKWSHSEELLDKECDEALQQIEKKEYARKYFTEGYEKILCYGAAFRGKRCLIKCKRD